MSNRKIRIAIISAAAALGIFIGGGFLYPVLQNQGNQTGLGKAVDEFAPVTSRHVAVFPLTYADTTADERDRFPSTEQLNKSLLADGSEVLEYLSAQSFGKFTLTGTVFETTQVDENYLNADGSPRWIDGFDSIDIPNVGDLRAFETIIFVPMHAKALSQAVTFDSPRTPFVLNGAKLAKDTGLIWLPLQVGTYPDGSTVSSFDSRWVGWAKAEPGEYVEGTWDSPLTQFQETFVHELLHDLGFKGHANSRTGDNEPYWLADKDAVEYNHEYGNPFDIMGYGSWSQGLSSFIKNRLGWVSDRVVTIEIGQTMTVTLAPNDSAQGVVGVQLFNDGNYTQWDYLQDTDFSETGYWIEVLPQSSNFSSKLDFVNQNSKGLIIHVTDGVSPFLLDASPSPLRNYEWGSSADLSDVALKAGQSFDDGSLSISNVFVADSGEVSFTVGKAE
jgi:hypothetical protein